MQKLKKLNEKVVSVLSSLQDFPLLFFRLILAYGFYEPAMTKLNNFNDIVKWFESMEMPMPTLNAYLATGAEVSGFILLTLGLATRYISIPLIIVMIVAIKTVHWEHGFPAGENGYEIPLYYMLMLFALLIFGGGRISADYAIKRWMK